MTMQIVPVSSGRELHQFIGLPYRLYKNDPVWVPPLLKEQQDQFNPKRNPLLDHCEYSLFLLMDQGQVIGRIAAFYDRLANDFWKELVGLFGYYECIPDARASEMLLGTAAEWLRAKGMKFMRGPWSFVSQEWGMVIDGYEPSPVLMAPYNPPYYNHHMEDFHFQGIRDLLCYAISGAEGYRIPERILTLTDDVKLRYGVTVRRIDMKHYSGEVERIIELSNQSLVGNWGYSPVTRAEVEAMARDMKPIIQPKGVLFAEDRTGRAIGFAITLPDINKILLKLKGHLFPFGWLKLITGIPRLHHYRMFALGVIPEFHGKGVDSLIYRAMYESLYTPDIFMEINYVLEDNNPMNNAIRKLNARPSRRYRVYQREI